MLTMSSFKKILIVEQLQGNYLNCLVCFSSGSNAGQSRSTELKVTWVETGITQMKLDKEE